MDWDLDCTVSRPCVDHLYSIVFEKVGLAPGYLETQSNDGMKVVGITTSKLPIL